MKAAIIWLVQGARPIGAGFAKEGLKHKTCMPSINKISMDVF
jgi:hypothetical protein